MFRMMSAAQRREARQEETPPLVGVWELQSLRCDGLPVEGPPPRACILFSPRGKFIAVVVGDNRSGLPSEKIAAAFRKAFAYSGTYRIAGDAWITTQQRCWKDLVVEGEQMHFFTIRDGIMVVRPGRGEFAFRKITQ